MVGGTKVQKEKHSEGTEPHFAEDIYIIYYFYFFPSASVTSKCQLRLLASLESDFKRRHVVKCGELQTPLGSFDFTFLIFEF